MKQIQSGDRELTCPCCDTVLVLPDEWVLVYDPPPVECARCGGQYSEGEISTDRPGLCSYCVAVNAYRETDAYRSIVARQKTLQASDVLAALDADKGGLIQAGRRLGVQDDGPGGGDNSTRWLRKWLQKRGLIPTLYEIRRKHGWTGEPPTKRPRKRPRPVLVFDANQATATDATA